jgi:hypothetical protein
MPQDPGIRRLLVLTGVTATATLAVVLLRASSDSPGTENALGFVGVVGVLATLGLTWALVDALRSDRSNAKDRL